MRSKKILIDGDIYIKIKPEIISFDKKQIERISNELEELNKEKKTEEIEYLKEQLRKLKKYYETVQLNFDGTDNFHCLKTDLDYNILYSYEKNGHLNVIECSAEQLKKNYLHMSKFLKEAQYIGKRFKRTQPSYSGKYKIINYMEEDKSIESTILYATPYAMLAQSIYQCDNDKTPYLEMIDLSFIADRQYEFVGPSKQLEEFDNKEKTYMKVYEEIEKRKNR